MKLWGALNLFLFELERILPAWIFVGIDVSTRLSGGLIIDPSLSF
jgi:hypothetical protein